MLWIKMHTHILNHKKTAILAKLLKTDNIYCVGLLAALWSFSMENAWEDGNLEPWGEDGIERACQWQGKSGHLVKSFQTARWLDGLKVHDWLDITADFVRKRKQRERSNKVKQYRSNDLCVTGQGPDCDRTRTGL